MSAESGGPIGEIPPAKWLLRSVGLRAETSTGIVGHVVAPLYDFSARWDRPRALAVRGPPGIVEVELDAIERIDAAQGRILLRATEA